MLQKLIAFLRGETPETTKTPEATKTPEIVKPPVKDVEVVVGLDFGTSLTKVVVAAPFEGDGLHYAVEFIPGTKTIERYLQPTVLYVNHSNQKYALSKFKRAEAESNLKLNFISWAENAKVDTCSESAVNVVIYLALIIKKAQKTFEEKSRKELGKTKFTWMLNLGIPAAALRDDNLTKSFRTAALVAWELAQSDKPNLELAKDLWGKEMQGVFEPTGTHRERINIYPELAAQTTGFILSKYGRDGLYLMIDVGAGTMDIALFHASQITGTPKINFYTGSVEFLGCLELFRKRREAIRQAKGDISWGEELITSNIGDLPFNKLEEREGADVDFTHKCRNAVYKQIGITKQNGYFDGNTTSLRNGLPYFLCGGGSGMEIYQSIPSKVQSIMIQGYHFGGFQQEVLVAPENLNVTYDSEDYHRLSVAYGLSMHFLNLPVQAGFVETLINQPQGRPDNHNEGRRRCRTAGCAAYPVSGGDFCYDCGDS